MPGIVGISTKMPRDWAVPRLLRMLRALRHETFYVAGVWVDEAVGIYVGWVARKNSFSDGMPLLNERKDAVLIFSGEDFPDAGTVYRLKQRGHDILPDGPSYLIHLYEEDSNFPASLNGHFHGILIEKKTGLATLFNDRYGLKRLYYCEAKGALYFAAEAKAILAVDPVLRNLDYRALGEYIACGCVLEDRTLFRQIAVLPPASAWTIRTGAITQKRKYFQRRDWEHQDQLEPEHYYQELKQVFTTKLPLYFQGPETIGMSLTGGLDSRAIMAWRKSSSRSLPCYTFGGMYRESRDVRVARQVARCCEQTHQVITVGEEFLSRFPRYAERTIYLTDGCADVGRSPDLYANEQAREIAPVRMTGNYGGEVLRGLRVFKPVIPPRGLFAPEFMPYVYQACETYQGLPLSPVVSFAAFLQAPWYHYGLLALEETQLSLRTPFLDNDLVRTVFRAPNSVQGCNACVRLVLDGNPALAKIGTDRGSFDNSRGIIAAVSRCAIGFLRKTEYAYDYGMPHWLALIDKSLSSLHPERLLLGRQKFFHFRVWYRDRLSSYVREVLFEPRALGREYLQRSQLEMLIRRHVSGDRNYTTAIHKMLSLELLHRIFLDSNCSPSSMSDGISSLSVETQASKRI